MNRDLVPVHFAVDGQAPVSVSARGLGGGGDEPLARVMTLCPLALITFPSINFQGKTLKLGFVYFLSFTFAKWKK